MEKIINNFIFLKASFEVEIAIALVMIVLLALAILCLTIIKKIKEKE